VTKKPDVAARFTGQGLQILGSSPAEFDRYLRVELERWARVVRSAEISIG
jgi:tripartite-type tricarboxylate transporter receptor subunit TctC